MKEDILILLPPYKTSHELWNSLCAKYYGSEEMIKTKKDLIKKEFDLFYNDERRIFKSYVGSILSSDGTNEETQD